jgi:hypothetical protein
VIIHRQRIAFVPDSQTGNLLAYLQGSSSGNFRSHLTRALVHLAQVKLSVASRAGGLECPSEHRTNGFTHGA